MTILSITVANFYFQIGVLPRMNLDLDGHNLSLAVKKLFESNCKLILLVNLEMGVVPELFKLFQKIN